MVPASFDAFGWAWSTFRPDLIAAVGLALALLVTGHVLLNKRDVGGAIGWIGLAFLSPIVGALLYVLFGVNRVARRARRLRGGAGPSSTAGPAPAMGLPEHLRPLDSAARRITGETALPGNLVTMLENGEQAYPAMLAAIDAARASIGLSTYILRDDAVGERFILALTAAHQRGVQVRVLVDAIGSGYFWAGAYRRLRQSGVPAARFMHSPLPWRMPFLNLRTHKKLLVVDGQVSFIGGMNISASNLASSRPRNLVRDTHFRVEGPVSRQLLANFAEDWSFAADGELEGEAWYPELKARGPTIARAVSSGPDADIEKIEFVMLQAFSCARRSITLMTPYFLPSELFVTSLAMAAMRGVEVDLVLPAVSNQRFVDWAEQAHVGPLLDNGIRIWRNPPPFDHSKLLVVDGEWCLFGSANLDMRSLRLNFELNLEAYDSALAAQVAQFIRSKMVRRLTSDHLASRPLPVRLRDGLVRLALPYI